MGPLTLDSPAQDGQAVGAFAEQAEAREEGSGIEGSDGTVVRLDPAPVDS